MPQQPLEYSSQAETSSLKTVARHARRWWPLLAVPLIVVVGLGLAWWWFNRLQVNDPVGASSPAMVQEYTDVAPPAEASNIRTAGFSQGMVWSHYVRFEAPVPVCLAYARRVAHGMQLTANFAQLDVGIIIQKDRRRLPNMNWFDLPNAANLVGADYEGKTVYVDQSRGVFYFFAGF